MGQVLLHSTKYLWEFLARDMASGFRNAPMISPQSLISNANSRLDPTYALSSPFIGEVLDLQSTCRLVDGVQSGSPADSQSCTNSSPS